MTDAPGWPGIAPRWTSSAKSGVGTALSPVSRVWFTLSHGILDEIYYPRVDQACTRDFGFIVTDGAGFFAEEKRDCEFDLARMEDGVPAFQLTSTHDGGRFRIVKYVLTDPRADVVMQRVRLEVLDGSPLRLFALLAPHLVNGGAHNTAWIGTYKGHRMLFAEGDGTRLALGCSRPFLAEFGGLRRDQRRLADAARQRQPDRAVRPRRRRQCRPDGRDRRSGHRVPARARLRPHRARGGVPRAREPADPVQCAARGIRRGLARLAGAAALARPQGGRAQRLSRQHDRAALPREPDLPRRADREPVDPLGQQQGRRRPRRLPPRLAARPGADRRRVPRLWRPLRGAAHRPLPARHPGGRRQLAAELLAGRLAVLERHAARRMRLPDAAAGHGVARGRHPAAPASRRSGRWWRARRASWSSHGPRTGQDRWEENAGYTPFTLAVQIAALLAAAETRRGLRGRRRRRLPARHGGRLERADRGLDLRRRTRGSAGNVAWQATTSASRRRCRARPAPNWAARSRCATASAKLRTCRPTN